MELSENESYEVLIGTTRLVNEIDAFYRDLVPDFSPDDMNLMKSIYYFWI